MEWFLQLLQSAGVPIAAVIVQAILTWYKVNDLGKRMARVESAIYGNGIDDGLRSRVKVLEVLEQEAGDHR